MQRGGKTGRRGRKNYAEDAKRIPKKQFQIIRVVLKKFGFYFSSFASFA
jgi:hypothetical protein